MRRLVNCWWHYSPEGYLDLCKSTEINLSINFLLSLLNYGCTVTTHSESSYYSDFVAMMQCSLKQ